MVFSRIREVSSGLFLGAALCLAAPLGAATQAAASEGAAPETPAAEARTAAPLNMDEVRRLSRLADPAPLDAALLAMEAQIAAGAAPHAAREAMRAFYTADPAVAGFISRWAAAFPESPHPYLARAAMHVHLAQLYRGITVSRLVLPENLARMRGEHARALPLVNRALELAPDNTFGAELLHAIGRYGGEPELRMRAEEIYERNLDVKRAFWQRYTEALPQWGGSLEALGALCAEAPPALDFITVEECYAAATVDIAYRLPAATRFEALSDAAKVLSGGEAGPRLERSYVDAMLAIGDFDGLAATARAHGMLLKPEALDRFVRARSREQDWAFVLEQSEAWLALDPDHPMHNAHKAQALANLGRGAEAQEPLARAMVLGERLPDVRMARIAAMAGLDLEEDGPLLEEAVAALEATSWHPKVFDGLLSGWSGNANGEWTQPAMSISMRGGRGMNFKEDCFGLFLQENAMPRYCARWGRASSLCRNAESSFDPKWLAKQREMVTAECPVYALMQVEELLK